MSATQQDVIVVGAGVAGLSAATALSAAGAKVALLERRPYIGGRAYSYEHPALEETIDSQHVVLGCCTNLIDLCNQSRLTDSFRWYDTLTFLEPNGRRSIIHPGPLPAPGHQALSFLSVPMLSLKDKAVIATGLLHFLHGYPADDSESFANWLQRTGQTDRAIRHFWEPVIVGALNDNFANCSVKYAGKVFHESFLRSPEAGRLGIPAAPLSDFFAPVAEYAQRQGTLIHLQSGVDSLRPIADHRWQLQSGDTIHEAQSIILATDFKQTAKLLSAYNNELPLADSLTHFIPAPITTIHLWFDRQVTDLDHAVLLDTRIQWMFAKSRIRRWPTGRGSYLELVISASWPELQQSREDILASALREAEIFFPTIKQATLLKTGVLKEARATFSVTPGLDRFRPQPKTPVPGIYLAGDWTATEWPSTMESAVRSGRLAAGAVLGDTTRFLAPETPASGLMRWLSKK